MKFTADLLIALILIVGCFILLILKIDGEVKTILIMAAGWSFGATYTARKGKSK